MNRRIQMLIDWRPRTPVEDLDPIEIEVEVEPEKKAFPEIIFSAQRKEEQQPSVPVEEVSG